VPLDSNIIKIPIEAMAKVNVDQDVREKILEYERAAIQNLKNRV
jgi:hypothetical protein